MKLFLRTGCKVVGTLLLLRILLRSVVRRREEVITIPQATPTQVWEYMADFSNNKILNPKLLDFQILSDSTNKRKKGTIWTYSVRYTEFFENIPFGTNTAVGNYSIFQDEKLQDLVITSVHETCLLPGNLWCLKTTAGNRFRFDQTGTIVQEVVDYSCPWLLLKVCQAEVESQRGKVLNNLKHTVF